MNRKKPPMGLVPKEIWEWRTIKLRATEIGEAIDRYVAAEKPVPWTWMKELKEINERLRVLEMPKGRA